MDRHRHPGTGTLPPPSGMPLSLRRGEWFKDGGISGKTPVGEQDSPKDSAGRPRDCRDGCRMSEGYGYSNICTTRPTPLAFFPGMRGRGWGFYYLGLNLVVVILVSGIIG